jgi:hypothetical protein
MDDYFDQHIQPREPADNPPPEAEAAPDQPLGENADADEQSTSPRLKAAIQELLRYGLVEHGAKPNLYRSLQQDKNAAAALLEPLDFELRFDETRGLVFIKIAAEAAGDSDEAWQHPLVRRQRLTTEQSLLVAILRQVHMAYEQDCGIGAGDARIDLDELRGQLDLYLGSSGSEQRDQNRLSNLLEQLHKHGIVSHPDKENQVHIRPIIVHLADPAQLSLLLEHFQQFAKVHPAEALAPANDD